MNEPDAVEVEPVAKEPFFRAPKVVLILIAVLAVLFWINWMWMQAHRGLMHDDPLVFAVKYKASLAAGVVVAASMVVGALGWPW